MDENTHPSEISCKMINYKVSFICFTGFWQWHITNRITWLLGSVCTRWTRYTNSSVLHICRLFMPEWNV